MNECLCDLQIRYWRPRTDLSLFTIEAVVIFPEFVFLHGDDLCQVSGAGDEILSTFLPVTVFIFHM